MLWMSYYSRSILFGFVFLFSCTSKSNCFLTHHVKIQILQSESLPQQSTLLRSLEGEDGGATSPQQTNDLKSASSLPIKCPNCDLCDGSGRILGGLGTLLPWLPIKAYRPCPNFINSGGFYERAGQGLEEIAFGREE